MIIAIESFDKLVAFLIVFICSIWLYCSYAESGRTNANLKDLVIYFIMMSLYELFAAAGMLFLTLDVEEVSVPLYNASYIIANLFLFLAYSEIIAVAIGLHFEKAELRANARKYYQAIIVIFGLVIIVVSAFYRARPLLDQETFLISANYDPFVFKMIIAMTLVSMGPASLLLTGRSFFSKEGAKAYVIMGAGVGLSLVGQLTGYNQQNATYLMLSDAVVVIGLIILFYGANLVDLLRKAEPINKKISI